MVNMRAGLPRLGTVCVEYRLGGRLWIVTSGAASMILR